MRRERALGFTLIELAVVILLISIFMGLGLSVLDVQQTNRAFGETREKQEKIKDALVTYLANFRRLPCPDTAALTAPGTPPDGVEDRVTPGNPTAACVDPGAAISGFGVIPYADLGLSRDDALDGWDNFFSYEVSHGVPNNEWALSTTFSPANGFFTGNGGGIILRGRTAAGGVLALNPPPLAGPALGIAAVIVSHGRNGSGAFTTKGAQNNAPQAALVDEIDNTNDANSVFFQREFTDVVVPGGGPFDDLVLALTPTDLLTPAIKDGALQSPSAQVFEQMRTIKDTVIGWIPANSPPNDCVPPDPDPPPIVVPAVLGLPPTVTVDPWTQPINYVRASAGPINLTGPPENAFCVWSNGQNRANDSGACGPVLGTDDIGPPAVTNAQLATTYSPPGATTCF